MQGAAARLGDTVPVLGGFPDVVTVALKKIGIRFNGLIGLMLDLGYFKIILGVFSPISSSCKGI